MLMFIKSCQVLAQCQELTRTIGLSFATACALDGLIHNSSVMHQASVSEYF